MHHDSRMATPEEVRDAVIEKLRAEAERQRAEARGAALLAEQTALELRREQRKEQEELTRDKYHKVYVFNGAVTNNSVAACMTQLNEWSRLEPGCDMEIIFDSPGGEVIPGMALFDFLRGLRARGHFITTVALGYAASMAGLLLQAGTQRVMGREAYVLIHEVSTGAIGKIGEIEDEVKFVKKIQKRVLDIFAERSKKGREYFARRWRRKDWWLDSEECLKIGFVDEVR